MDSGIAILQLMLISQFFSQNIRSETLNWDLLEMIRNYVYELHMLL